VSHVYVTSDWHIGHTGITSKFRTEFPTDEVHDSAILRAMKLATTKRDVLFVLGDVTWTQSGLQKIREAEIPARMIMVRGNHDTLPTIDYLSVFDEVEGAYRYKGFWFTHIPIHPQELFRGGNVHGHCHRGGPWETNQEAGYFNAILEFNDYAPVNMEVVKRTFEARTPVVEEQTDG